MTPVPETGEPEPGSLDEILDPAHSVLLVIDVQNDEMSPRGAVARHGIDIGYMRSILDPLRGLIAAARRNDVPVVYTLSSKSGDGSMEGGPTHRFLPRKRPAIEGYKIEGSWGSKVAEELEPLDTERRIVKFHSSAFVGTPLEHYLGNLGARTGVVAGTATEGCVEATVRSLQDHGYYPVVAADCVTSMRKDLHDAAMTVMSARWDVLDAQKIADVWGVRRGA